MSFTLPINFVDLPEAYRKLGLNEIRPICHHFLKPLMTNTALPLWHKVEHMLALGCQALRVCQFLRKSVYKKKKLEPAPVLCIHHILGSPTHHLKPHYYCINSTINTQIQYRKKVLACSCENTGREVTGSLILNNLV